MVTMVCVTLLLEDVHRRKMDRIATFGAGRLQLRQMDTGRDLGE